MPNILKLTTIQSQPFRSLFEALKEVLTDCNIHFDEKGMKILRIDGSHVALVHNRLYAKNFQEYYCEKPFTIGVNVISFFKLLKNITSEGMLTLYIDSDNKNELGIIIQNNNKSTTIDLTYKLLDIDEDDINLPNNIEFDFEVTMPSADFQNLCRNMSIVSDTLEIKCCSNELIMSCHNSDFAPNFSVTFEDNNDGTSCVSFVKTAGDEVVYQGKFPMKFMLLFTKATSLSKTIELYLKNDYPIVLNFVIADLGELKFLLSPKLDEQQ